MTENKIIILIVFVLVLNGCTGENKKSMESDADNQESIVTPETAVRDFYGYLVDVTCGLTGKGLDGAVLAVNPENHTKHCLEACAASGFGIMTKTEDNESYRFIKFDGKGNKISAELLNKITDDTPARITATGTFEDGIISIESIVLNDY